MNNPGSRGWSLGRPWLIGLLCWFGLLGAVPGQQARPANAGVPPAPMSQDEVRKLQDQAVAQVREFMVELERQIIKVKLREREAEAQAELKRLALRKSYYQGFLNKIATLREIETLQQRLTREEPASGPELDKQIAQLMALGTRYQEALKLISTSNAEFLRLQGEPLQDPVTIMLHRRQDSATRPH